MKKIIIGLLTSFIITATANALTIDKNSIEVTFEGYKTSQMLGLEGKFKDVKYSFGDENSSIASTLKGATAVIKPSSLDTGVEDANKNLINTFFPMLMGKNDIKVTFADVVEGENVGTITVNLKLDSKKRTTFPLVYTIKDNKLEAKGQLDLSVFNTSKKALEALSKVAPGHGGMSWPIVYITFTANVIESK